MRFSALRRDARAVARLLPDGLTATQHVHAAWDLHAGRPRLDNPAATPPPAPLGALHALDFVRRQSQGYLLWLEAQLRYWEGRAAALHGRRQAWRDQLPAHADAVLPPGLHQPLLREMLQVADWPDAALLKHIEGFPLAGPLPDTGHYAQALGASAPDATFLHAELQRALQDAPQELLRLLRSARPDATSAEVLRQTRAEAAAGKFAGPWQVCTLTGRRCAPICPGAAGCRPSGSAACRTGPTPVTR